MPVVSRSDPPLQEKPSNASVSPPIQSGWVPWEWWVQLQGINVQSINYWYCTLFSIKRLKTAVFIMTIVDKQPKKTKILSLLPNMFPIIREGNLMSWASPLPLNSHLISSFYPHSEKTITTWSVDPTNAARREMNLKQEPPDGKFTPNMSIYWMVSPRRRGTQHMWDIWWFRIIVV